MKEVRIVIGDWSKDGHNKMEFFTFQCSHEEKDIKKAYKAAIKKCKVSLHDDGGRLRNAVCCNYEDSIIPADKLRSLKELGVNFDFRESKFHKNDAGEDEMSCNPQDIANLFFAIVKTQIPGFEYKLVKEKNPINGFWSKDFNFSFGYGCFYG
jgi:hypothetical protein